LEAKVNVDELVEQLTKAGFAVAAHGRTANNYGHQIRLKSGLIINLWDKGKVSYQGKRNEEHEEVINAILSGGAEEAPFSNNVFVVYGHDDAAKQGLENLLRKWGLEPLFLDQLPSEGQTVIEKLEKYQGIASYAVVLATPDDEGFRAGRDDERAFRARQNVVLELGMMLAKLGRPRVAILVKDQAKMEKPSDIQGLIYIPFKDEVTDARLQLAKEMNAQGFHIRLEKL
jgi:predicted nucleotide-binding protein